MGDTKAMWPVHSAAMWPVHSVAMWPWPVHGPVSATPISLLISDPATCAMLKNWPVRQELKCFF